ncbi:mpv17-like protein 2 [Anticarsia gemmatalis]|uniref:mpv17-like protein 2 n=1 Tax=Anticarsia gemmatalis TaxID=129554 RepID=UPI003F765E64
MFALRCMTTRRTWELKHFVRKTSTFHRGINFLFKRTLLFTNSITSGGCMVLGDIAQQEFEYRSHLLPYRYDWGRAARMFIVGTLMGPLHHYYYLYLDKLIPKVNVKTVFIKIACDQAIASPLTLLGFFYGMGVLERKSLEQCTDEVKDKLLYTYMGDCIYWPPIQFINFYYLPTHYRVVYINVATMIFNVFLSYMKHFDQH